jgi:hypothetical protein
MTELALARAFCLDWPPKYQRWLTYEWLFPQLERASDRFSEGGFTHWSLGSRCSANYHNASQPSDFKSALTPSAF